MSDLYGWLWSAPQRNVRLSLLIIVIVNVIINISVIVIIHIFNAIKKVIVGSIGIIILTSLVPKLWSAQEWNFASALLNVIVVFINV